MEQLSSLLVVNLCDYHNPLVLLTSIALSIGVVSRLSLARTSLAIRDIDGKLKKLVKTQ